MITRGAFGILLGLLAALALGGVDARHHGKADVAALAQLPPYNGGFVHQLLWTVVVLAVAVAVIAGSATWFDGWTIRRKQRRLDLKRKGKRP